jgi:hypothetical protein
MNKAANNLKNQKAFEERKKSTHTRCNVWVENDVLDETKEIAKAEGITNVTGRKAGEINLEGALSHVLKAGIKSLKKD